MSVPVPVLSMEAAGAPAQTAFEDETGAAASAAAASAAARSHCDALHAMLWLGPAHASAAGGFAEVLSCVPAPAATHIFALRDEATAPLLAAADAAAAAAHAAARASCPALLCCAAGQSRSPALAAALLLAAVGGACGSSAVAAAGAAVASVARARACAAPNAGFLAQLALCADVRRGGAGARARARTALQACARAALLGSGSGGFALVDEDGSTFAWLAGADSRAVLSAAATAASRGSLLDSAAWLDPCFAAGVPPPPLLPLLYAGDGAAEEEPAASWLRCDGCHAALASEHAVLTVGGCGLLVVELQEWMLTAAPAAAPARAAARAAARAFAPRAAPAAAGEAMAATGRLCCPCCGAHVGRWSWLGVRLGGQVASWPDAREVAARGSWPAACRLMAPAFALDRARVRASVS